MITRSTPLLSSPQSFPKQEAQENPLHSKTRSSPFTVTDCDHNFLLTTYNPLLFPPSFSASNHCLCLFFFFFLCFFGLVGLKFEPLKSHLQMREESGVGSVVVVREFDPKRDCLGVEMVERRCEVGPTGKMSLYTDLMGDPICRVRHSPAFLMLVAEVGVDKEIVGVIRGCIKTVTCGKKLPRIGKKESQNVVAHPIYTKLAYLLGLRVSPSHRRMGIGLKLVSRMENWFRQNGAEYSYMATEKGNEASLKLFTERCGYTKFRTPSILVQPVFAHRVKIPNRVTIFRLSALDSETLYGRRFSTTEFFPRDIDSILHNKLNLGTFLAVPAGTYKPNSWPGSNRFLSDPPESWAVLSIWNSKEVFRLEVRGAPLLRKWLARTSRAVDRLLPWLRIPSVPEVFRPFGLHFMYGLGGEGPDSVSLTRALCAHAHNVARTGGCGVVATEVACADPLRLGIPHWKRLSCAEDLWCVKRLGEDYSDGSVGDWTKSVPGPSIFVDPREF